MRSTPNEFPVAPPSGSTSQDASRRPSATPTFRPNLSPQSASPPSPHGDKVHLSKQAQETSQGDPPTTASAQMSRAERQILDQLQARDREVKTHEQAHIAAGGPYVSGGASYSYRIGPDGKMYAVGGEVSIDVSPVPGNPEATIEKAQAIQRSATAPAEPSAQDAIVASKARAMESEARAELRQEEHSEAPDSTSVANERTGRVAAGVSAGSDVAPLSELAPSAGPQRATEANSQRPDRLEASDLELLLQAAESYTSMAIPPAHLPSAGLSLHA
ncbi:putative metalloprotease CJM1_0395 family protein [Desulfohalobium retbaense]|uniref:SrpA-related protein n=1 Tax=Desulfohalobium retbaense (strain ATCC 49708 / DSM 5692 / JCM 16813 / HR100) TaxID=485915 RepID=C8WYY9_DESRD|nr:putative metalloprotease CJM1_0395 family protein [Desulfohalobium retbaense]ACV67905.1 hypothetical protein Dret_0608 [Desulfohalobium retbaense DSM 5692]